MTTSGAPFQWQTGAHKILMGHMTWLTTPLSGTVCRP